MKIFKILFLVLCFTACTSTVSEIEDMAAIKKVLRSQEEAWSNNNLEGFMQGY